MLEGPVYTTNPYSTAHFLTTGWRGLFPLPIAFWGYYVLGRLLVLGVVYFLILPLGFFGWFIGIIIWIPYWFWSLIMLWRCADNTEWPILFYALRIWLYFEGVAAIFYLPYLTMTDL